MYTEESKVTTQKKFWLGTESSARKDKSHSQFYFYAQMSGGITIHKATVFSLQSSSGRAHSSLAILSFVQHG